MDIPISIKDPLPILICFLCRTLQDVKRFVRDANDQHNDRPKWKSPTTEAEWVEMEKRLAEFKEYAEIWMEKGLLGK